MRTIEEFYLQVNKTDTCWLWKGSKTTAGYGNLNWFGRYTYAHILAYRFKNGSPAKGTELDHRCRVRHCCNPDHLEPVSHATNIRRSPSTKLSTKDVESIRYMLKLNIPNLHIGKYFKVSHETIRDIRDGVLWR